MDSTTVKRNDEVFRHICLQLPIASMLFSSHHVVR